MSTKKPQLSNFLCNNWGFLFYYNISRFAYLAINLLCPDFSKSISTFKSSPSGSTLFIIPSPNYNGTAFDEYIMVELLTQEGLNKEIDEIVARENVLREEIKKIISEIEV